MIQSYGDWAAHIWFDYLTLIKVIAGYPQAPKIDELSNFLSPLYLLKFCHTQASNHSKMLIPFSCLSLLPYLINLSLYTLYPYPFPVLHLSLSSFTRITSHHSISSHVIYRDTYVYWMCVCVILVQKKKNCF